MKLLIYSDPHIVAESSIIQGKGSRLSIRLEMLISTYNWMNDLASSEGCDKIICLGDLVEAPNLTAEELTAISMMNMQDHFMILGNHDKYSFDGYINSASIYKEAYKVPTVIHKSDEFSLIALPHGPLIDIQGFISSNKLDPSKAIILSHNDVKGIFYGNHMTNNGYEFKDILRSCRLFLNGHIHTGKTLVKDRIYNIGTISGLNFNCVGSEWNPSAFILDTNTFSITRHENPYGFVFDKVEFTDRLKLIDYFRSLASKSYNLCLQIKVPITLVDDAREWIKRTKCVMFSRVLSVQDKNNNSNKTEDNVSFIQTASIYGLLHEYCQNNTNPDKYDLNCIYNELELMESKG